MEVKFGKDYQDYFDTKAYLSTFSSGKPENFDWAVFSSRGFHDLFSNLPKKNLRILEFGGGPNINNLISAGRYAEEIIFAEYSEKNRQVVGKWRENLPDTHDWSSYFRFIVETLEGNSSGEAAIRESELRKKIRHILPCDIDWEDPVEWPSSWSSQSAMFDVVTTSLCLEACVTSDEGYRHAIAKLKRYLKPGGYLAMFGVIGESFYMVGQEKFYCFPLSKKLIEATLASEGFQMLGDMKFLACNWEPYCDAKELFFVAAVLQED